MIELKGEGVIKDFSYDASKLYEGKNLWWIRIVTNYGDETIFLVAKRTKEVTRFWNQQLVKGAKLTFEGYMAGGKMFARSALVKKKIVQQSFEGLEAS
ncbi:hypothetical protein ACXWTF_12855 [Thiomicrolovo sp. ZZH C-3]